MTTAEGGMKVRASLPRLLRSEVLFPLCASTDPQRDSIFTKDPSDVLDHATSEIASGSKLGIDATKKIPGKGFKRPWPPLIQMDEAVRGRNQRSLRPLDMESVRLRHRGWVSPDNVPPTRCGVFGIENALRSVTKP